MAEDNLGSANDQFAQAFYLFSRNEDGFIPITELATVMRSLGQNPSYAEIESYINEFDPDQHGVLDFESFKDIMQRRFASEDKSIELNEAFRAFDPDGKGVIDIEEFREALLNLQDTWDEKQIDEVCNELDTENTGQFFYPPLVQKMMAMKALNK